MNLEPKSRYEIAGTGEHGYAMAALLVAMAVMAILMSVALPTWNQTLRREKEEELIFRGNQYARALGAYQRKYANASPQSLDVLIEQHFLRKKYKDPLAVTEDGEFALLHAGGQPTRGQSGQPNAGAGAGAGIGTLATTEGSGPIIGVASKNTGESLRTYNDHNHYNEWQFMALQQSTQAGGTQAGAGRGGTQGGGTTGGGRSNGPGGLGGDRGGSRGQGPGGQGLPVGPGRGFPQPPR